MPGSLPWLVFAKNQNLSLLKIKKMRDIPPVSGGLYILHRGAVYELSARRAPEIFDLLWV